MHATPAVLDLVAMPLPLLGRLVPAGFPSPADDHLEGGIDVARYLVERPRRRSEALMRAINGLDARFGRYTVHPAAMGTRQALRLRADHHSPCYTTRLTELPVARA